MTNLNDKLQGLVGKNIYLEFSFLSKSGDAEMTGGILKEVGDDYVEFDDGRIYNL